MSDLPQWVIQILTVCLSDWVQEQGGTGGIDEAARHFGVEPRHIILAVTATGRLDIQGDTIVVSPPTTEGRA